VEEEKKRLGRPIKKPMPWGELYRKEGGEGELAQKLGVSKSTIGKWAIGVHRVPELAKKELLRLCKKHGIKSGIDEFESQRS